MKQLKINIVTTKRHLVRGRCAGFVHASQGRQMNFEVELLGCGGCFGFFSPSRLLRVRGGGRKTPPSFSGRP